MIVAIERWFKRHIQAAVRHPHHYITAAGLTAFAFMIGHFETGAVTSAWMYALLENLTDSAH